MNESPTDIGTLIEPPPVGFAFGAPGWYVVGALLVLLAVAGGVLAWRRYRRNRYRREALKIIDNLVQTTRDRQELVYETNMLLKRIALRLAPRESVAALRQQEWITFLNDTGRQAFRGNIVAVFDAVYNGSVTETDANNFVAMARVWITHHHRHTKHQQRQSDQPKPQPA